MGNIPEENFDWLELPAEVESINKFRTFILEHISSHLLLQDKIDEANLAMEEVVMNIIEHGYGFNKDKHIRLGCYLDENHWLHLCIEDNGKSYNVSKSNSLTAVDLSTQEKEGFGHLLIKRLTDKLDFTSNDSKNILYMGFQLE